MKARKEGTGDFPQVSGFLADVEEASHQCHSHKEMNSTNNLKEPGGKASVSNGNMARTNP